MLEKIKPYVPVAILVLLVLIIGYWAVMVTLSMQVIQSQTIKNSQEIQQIVTFLQQSKVAPQVNK